MAYGPEPGLAVGETGADVIGAFSEVAAAINDGIELDPLLHLIAEKVCLLLSVRRCSVYLRDGSSTIFRGQVAHSNGDIDMAIKRLTAGIESDGFTREIVATHRPVLISNAQSDPRPVRAAMVAFNVHTMLGVPMVLRGAVTGLLFLDNEDVPHEYTEAEQELSLTFAGLAAIAISQAKLTSELRATLSTAAQQNTALRRAAAIEDQLTDLLLGGANLGTIAAAITEMTAKACAIHDAEHRLLASAPADDGRAARLFAVDCRGDPAVQEALEALTARRPSVIGPIPSTGLHGRFLVARVHAGGDDWGSLVLAESGGRFGARDMIVARRTAALIALELSGKRRAAEAESYAIEALSRDLLHGSDDPDSLTRRADYHGLPLGLPHLAVLLSLREGQTHGRLSSAAVGAAFEQAAPGLRAFFTSVDRGAAVILDAPAEASRAQSIDRAKAIVRDVIHALAPDGSIIGGISAVCLCAADYPGAYEQTRQITRAISTFGSADGIHVLAADDLGAGRLLLSAADQSEADRFVRDTLGGLLDRPDPGIKDLFDTLEAFIACSRSVRRAAESLGVHENTIRYRLSRIAEISGLDVVMSGDDQFAAQLALLILRLEGRRPGGQLSDLVAVPNPADGVSGAESARNLPSRRPH